MFQRSFAIKYLADWDAQNPGNTVRVLFDKWALPGQKSTSKAPLRLGIREGSVIFYVKGQLIAQLSCGSDGPRLSVHNAYVSGQARKIKREGTLHGLTEYNAKALADPATASLVAGWIKTAVTYAWAVKRFGDDLFAANPGIIDLEMGEPASHLPCIDQYVMRMDIVNAQVANGVSASIAFWEVKCANTTDLRPIDGNAPKVLDRLDRFVLWISESGRIAQVAQAYRNTAGTLIELYNLFRSIDHNAPECVRLWQALMKTKAPVTIVQPSIVIGNYWPEGYIEQIEHFRMRQCAESFAKNKRRELLERHGCHVHEVGPDHGKAILPVL